MVGSPIPTHGARMGFMDIPVRASPKIILAFNDEMREDGTISLLNLSELFICLLALSLIPGVR